MKRKIIGRAKSLEEIIAIGKRLADTKEIDYEDKRNWVSLDNFVNAISSKKRYKKVVLKK